MLLNKIFDYFTQYLTSFLISKLSWPKKGYNSYLCNIFSDFFFQNLLVKEQMNWDFYLTKIFVLIVHVNFGRIVPGVMKQFIKLVNFPPKVQFTKKKSNFSGKEFVTSRIDLCFVATENFQQNQI